MKGIGTRSLGYGAGLLTLVAVGWILTGRAASPRREGLPTDWSHRHVIFSQPSTDAQAAAVMHDPRYWQQWNREHFARNLNVGDVGLSNRGLFATVGASHADWSQNLGSGASAGAGVFPAKYSFRITSAICAGVVGVKPDYVVFSTGLQGASGQASIVAFDNLYAGCTGSVPMVYWAFLDIWRHSERMKEVRSIRLKDLTTCTSCSHVGSCTRCPGLAFMEGNMRGPSSQDCEKSFARTGVPSANMLAKKQAARNLVQIRLVAANSVTQPSGAIA
jgi:hypothetical protein